MKKKTTTQLKHQLDQIFSIYIRQSYADINSEVGCYTCPKKLPWKEIQCGHFVSRASLATRFDEENCRPQCVGCNVFAGGRTAVFANKLEAEKKGTVARLYKKAQEITKYYPYEEKIEEYQEKLSLIN